MKRRCALAAPIVALALSSLVVATGCDGDRAADGARGSCAEGGSLGSCQGEIESPLDACDRMVACAAIPRDAEEENGFDWGRCVDRLDSVLPEQASFIMACIGAATCDELKTQGSPNAPQNRGFCFEFGDR
jgi:hypothetical protein